MKYFYDTEFIENGKTIKLISIGIVAEDGREYYAINSGMPMLEIRNHEWLMDNVWPHLPLVGRKPINTHNWPGDLDMASTLVKPKRVIRNEVREFLLRDSKNEISLEKPELWAYYGAYDHVLLAQLFGTMVNLPEGIPMVTHDILTLSLALGVDMLPKQPADAHNALADAKHVKTMYDHIQEKSSKRGTK